MYTTLILRRHYTFLLALVITIVGYFAIYFNSTNRNARTLEVPSSSKIVLILEERRSDMTSKALQRLGCINVALPDMIYSSLDDEDSPMFSKVSLSTFKNDIVEDLSTVKIIVAKDSKMRLPKLDHNKSSNDEGLLDLAELEREQRLLKIDTDREERYWGEGWDRMCMFLGGGYSAMERLHLREFPRSEKGLRNRWHVITDAAHRIMHHRWREDDVGF